MTWTTLVLLTLLWTGLFGIGFRRQLVRGTAAQYLASLAAVEAATIVAFLLFHQPRPGERLIDTVERRLAAHPCTARLDRRWREYRYAKGGNGTTDRRWVTFVLRDGRPPGRAAYGVGEGWPQEEGRLLVARGRYEIESDRLSVDYCGPTLGARHRP